MTQTPILPAQPLPQKRGRAPKFHPPCTHCRRPATGARGLCSRDYRRWKRGDPSIVPEVQQTKRRPRLPAFKPPCRECQDQSKTKGLCGFHYGRKLRAPRRGKCTIPRCRQPLRHQGRLYCPDHAGCVAPRCTFPSKARRLCKKHYQNLYLGPRDRKEKERQKVHQGEFVFSADEWTIPVPDAPEGPRKFIMGQTAPPLHEQVGCNPDQVALYQKCADALTLLQANGILPPATVAKGRSRTVRQISRMLKTSDRNDTAHQHPTG